MSTKFNLLELTDLALMVPEKGAVNFNILHTVITSIIKETGIGSLKPPCDVKDEALAQAAVTRARMRGLPGKREARPPTDLKSKLKAMRRREGSGLKKKSDDKKGKLTVEEKGAYDESDREKQQSSEASNEPEETKLPKDEDKETEEETHKTTDSDVDQESKASSEEELQEDTEKKMQEKLSDIRKRSSVEGDDETKILTSEQIEDMQETARDILEESADALAEKAAVVTNALAILADEDLLDAEPARVMEEVWRATNVNRRLDAAEEGLRNLSDIVDEMYDRVENVEDESKDVFSKTEKLFEEIMKFVKRINDIDDMCKWLREAIDNVSDQNKSEIDRLEEIISRLQVQINELEESSQQVVKELEKKHNELVSDVAFKTDLEKVRLDMNDIIEAEVSGIRDLINALREECVPKIDFAELESRVETLEETKVNREEMGRLLEPGFVDNFLEEQESLRADVDGLKKTVSYLEEDLNNLTTRVEEEIVKSMEQQFEEIGQMLEVMNAKLATLDADEINDSFANLEDQAAMLIKELEDMKNAHDLFKKEAKLNFNKISNVNALLDKLEQSKVDKSKLYELLELKADVDMIRNKLDRSEFLSMKRTIMEDLERLTITVKINEEEMSEGIRKLRQDFALKMYTEDFVTATEPIRNRIKALMYELKKVKEIALAQLFPDAPGVIKCFGCKRAANLLSYNYQGSGDDEDPPISQRTRSRAVANSSQPTSKTTSDLRFPPIDIDNVPIPPPDKKREVPPDQLPMLIANAKPNIGLPWERRKADIDRELRAYFATRKIRPIGGGYTQSQPQQKGLKFTTKVLKSEKVVPEIKSLREPKEKKGFIKPVLKKVPPSSSRRNLVPSSIGLHVNEDPAKTTSYTIEADRIDAEQSETDSNSSDIKNKNEEQ